MLATIALFSSSLRRIGELYDRISEQPLSVIRPAEAEAPSRARLWRPQRAVAGAAGQGRPGGRWAWARQLTGGDGLIVVAGVVAAGFAYYSARPMRRTLRVQHSLTECAAACSFRACLRFAHCTCAELASGVHFPGCRRLLSKS